MDLNNLIRVVRQRRRLLILGFGAAIVLAVMAYARPAIENGRPTLKPRGEEIWRSEEILFVSQPGFPAGRGVPLFRPSDPQRGTPAVAVDDQSRLANLAPLYAQFATGDDVRALVLRKGRIASEAEIGAEPITYTTTQFAYPQVLPLISLNATAWTPERATRAVQRYSAAFRAYMTRQQESAGISVRDRVFIRVLKKASVGDATLFAGRSKIGPILVFLALAILTVGLALVLDNLQRAARAGPEDTYVSPTFADEPPSPFPVEAAEGGARVRRATSRRDV
jgi:hypothetical protein